jgi:hypothetical protein
MSGYSENPAHVRVDFYKPESGKWYMTEMLDMDGHYYDLGPYNAVRNALLKTRHADSFDRWIISVVEPYHENGYPVLLTPGRATYSTYPHDGRG